MKKRIEIGVLYGVRALMIGCVCHMHIWQQSWLALPFDFIHRTGYLLVDGMLLLSGFLLYLPYAQQTDNEVRLSTKRFYQNRLIRIIPSYVLAILVALFCFALPQGAYHSTHALTTDLITHATFTFTFFPSTYLHTPLNGALWTLAIEMQFYLIFPFLAKWMQRKPILTSATMIAISWCYRYAIGRQADTAMLINQLPAFLDVYALGFLGAMAYCALRNQAFTQSKWTQWGFVGLSLLAFGALMTLQMHHATMGAGGFEAIRRSQALLRFPLAVILITLMLSLSFTPRLLQKILDNRFFRFISTISLNLYIWHQFLSVQMRIAFMPDNFRENTGLQWAYTLLCFSVSILVAMMATYGIEIPISKRCKAYMAHKERG